MLKLDSAVAYGKEIKIFVPAKITDIKTYDKDEYPMREIELTLPERYPIPGSDENASVIQMIRPGNAFLALPDRSLKPDNVKQRAYTCSDTTNARKLRTIIDQTRPRDEYKPDTSVWWQSEKVVLGKKIGVRAVLNEESRRYEVFNVQGVGNTSGVLDTDWKDKKYLLVTLGTGFTLGLAYINYMLRENFGGVSGTNVLWIMSVKVPSHIAIYNQLAPAFIYGKNFSCVPFLTQKWPDWWPDDQKGRYVTKLEDGIMDVSRLERLAPDLNERHVRYCGGESGLRDLQQALRQMEGEGQKPLSFRYEKW